MSEHRRRRRPQLSELEAIEKTELEGAQEPAQEPIRELIQEPEQQEAQKQTAAGEKGKDALKTLKNAGIILLGLLALLGEKIAVGADAARRALKKHVHLPQQPARDIEHMAEEPAQGSAIKAASGEAAHGAAARRRQREAQHREHIRWGMMAVCACVAVISLVMMGQVLVRSVRTRMLNAELSQRRAQLSEKDTEQAQNTADAGGMPAELSQDVVIFEGTPEPEMIAALEQPEQSEEPALEAPAETAPAVRTARKPVVKSTQYHVSSGTPLPQMAALYEENRDLIGWLEIPEVLDLPVMYKDNDYYLRRDFNKQKNESGTLFLDENHPFSELAQNLLLHGHNMKDGTMFGRLLQYHTDIGYLKGNPFVNFDTLWKEEKYVIFAVLRVSLDVRDEEFFNYFSYPRFESDEEFNAYIRRLQLRSEYAIPLDVQPSDALLTLSTCLDEDRLVIVCRRFREGETRTQLRQIVHLATRQ